MASPKQTIQAYSADGETVQCMKCERPLHTKNIAMLMRTKPTDAFNAWCAACTAWFVHKAADRLEGWQDSEVLVLF